MRGALVDSLEQGRLIMQIDFPIQALDIVKNVALSSPEVESCGYVFKNGDVTECLNRADNPELQFKISASDHLAASRDERGIAAIWHSHVDSPNLTEADLRASWQLKIPYLVVNLKTLRFDYYNPNLPEPLIGRQWRTLRTNCYSLVRDYYAQRLGVELPMGWLDESKLDEPGYDPVGENYGPFFDKMPPSYNLLNGDILVFRLGTANAMHCAVVTDVNQNLMLHHPLNQLSRYEIIGHSWMKHCDYVLRFKGGLPNA
jgi:proteasome lid subunit RPN8/RPN11